MAVPLCVSCGSDDAQKVSSVYRAGVYTSHTHGHRFGYHRDKKGRWKPDVQPYSEQTTHKSQLAELLSPPTKPFFWAGVLPFVLLGALLVAGALCTQSLAQMIGQELAQIVNFLIFLCYHACRIGSWLWKFEKQQYREYKISVGIWKAACRKWGELYYCASCDTVFDPASGASAPITSMKTLFLIFSP